MPAFALTDHGNILGTVHFYKELKKNDIKPIVGCEMYVAPESRFNKPDKKNNLINYHHLVILIQNQQGYRNLSELITASFLEGFYRKPRIDKEILEKYKEGIIVLSSCIQGEIPYLLLRDKEEKAYEAAKWYREIFKDNFYIEIQNHSLSDQLLVLPKLIQLSKDLSIPLVASNDVHYLNKEDADAREVLICLQTNEVLSNQNRAMKKATDEMYLKSYQEMAELFGDIPGSLDTTLEIAAKCNFDYKLGKYYLPEFSVPDQWSVDGYFEMICRQGFEKIRDKLKGKKHSIKEHEDRLIYEIDQIRGMGFPGYFLIVWDIIKYAKENGISVGPGRGSVVGSLVAYVMGITNIDPLDYYLIFERFLNPERISMPDIDIDFDGERREEVIEYIRQKYGENCVAQIVTFGKMKAKMAIRDIGRVLEIPLADVNRLAKMISEGPKVRLKEEINTNPDLQKAIKQMPENKRLIDYALKLENNIRQTGKHAAGVVIAPKELTEFMPLYKIRNDIVTQFGKDEVEEIGLLKMDILGLKTLTIIKNIVKEVSEVEGETINLDEIPLDDKKTYHLFQEGDTDGIFQFESSGMREYLKRSKPTRFEDLIVLNALYRPGPLGSGMADSYVARKLGKEPVVYILPELEEILEETYGIIVFQEQVMRISVKIAGFAMSKADEMRKIMGKKLTHKIPRIEKEFIERAVKKKYSRKKAEKLFSQMRTFAEYGFNKSHSTAYAYLAFITAYLKTHYPVYFMTANLSSESEKTSTSSKVIQYISECRKMGLEILPPDINKSNERFSVDSSNSIRFGLKGLKNVGETAIRSILNIRNKEGEFKSYSDFILGVDLAKVNKAVIESLIKSGALDCFKIKRKALLESVEYVIKQATFLAKNNKKDQKPLFTGEETGKQIVIDRNLLEGEELDENEIIKGEKEITGLYISQNPLEKYLTEIDKVSNTSIAELLSGDFKGDVLRIAGLISDYKQRKSKKGDLYGELYFEDLTSRIKILAFKDRWEKLKDNLKLDFPYLMEGRLPDNIETNPNIYLESLEELDVVLKKKARKILIKINSDLLDKKFNDELKEKMLRNKDSVPFLLIIRFSDGYKTMIGPSEADIGLKPTLTMKKDIEMLTGDNTVEILY